MQAMIEACMQRWGRIDILHNNVGISVAGNDAAVEDITTAAFDAASWPSTYVAWCTVGGLPSPLCANSALA